MAEDVLSKLTERQLECLRLAARHLETKEIARALSISPSAVEQRIKGAVVKLGVANRREAIRLLALAEGAPAYGSTPYGSSEVERNPSLPSFEDQEWSPEELVDGPVYVAEEQASFAAASSPPTRWKWPFPTRGRPRNDLSTLERILWVPVVAIIGGASLIVLVVIAQAALHVFKAVYE